MNKKHIFAGIVGAVALAGGFCAQAQAADLAVYRKAPYVAPHWSWSGFYLGGNFGGAFSRESIGSTVGNFGLDPGGVLGGVQFGYNFQIAPNFLIGVEGELDWTSATGNASFTIPGGGGAPGAGTFTSNHRWYDTVTGRLGYVQGDWLFYVKGGAAWMKADYGVTTNTGFAMGTGSNRDGWTIGGGAEFMIAPNWSAKLEYSYLDFGNQTVNLGPAGASFNTEVHEVKVGVNYHFPTAFFGRY
jgi:opacity protein-like surface antigen